MDIFVLMNKFKNSPTSYVMYITTTFAYWEMLLSTTIIPGLVINEKGNIEIRAKLSTVGQELAPSLRMGLDGKISEIILYVKYERKLQCK